MSQEACPKGRIAKFGPEHEGRDLVRTLCSQTISTRLVHTGFQHIFKHPPVGQTIRTHLQRRYQEVVYQRIVCTSAQIMCKRAARARPRHIVSFSKPLRKGLVSLSGSSTRIIRPQYQAWHLHGLTATHSLDPVGDSRIMATPFDRRHWNQNGYGICYCCCSCCFCCCCRCCSCHRYCRTFLSPQKSSTSEQ